MPEFEHLDKLVENLDKSPRFRYSTTSKEFKQILNQLSDNMYVELVGRKHSDVGDGEDMFSVEVSLQFTLSRAELREARREERAAVKGGDRDRAGKPEKDPKPDKPKKPKK